MGERVKDVTTHPAFRNTARMFARWYDRLHELHKEDLERSKDPSGWKWTCLLYTSPSPRDRTRSRMPSSA